MKVSTHSHPKVAAFDGFFRLHADDVSTHSHPKVAAQLDQYETDFDIVSTHSHPKVAADGITPTLTAFMGFNTQPHGGGC